jgi:hypothetical protein
VLGNPVSPPGLQSPASSEVSPVMAAQGRYQWVLADFPAVVNANRSLPPVIMNRIEHHIVTTCQPIASKFHLPDSQKLLAAKVEFKQLEADSIIRRSTSPWSSHLHIVKKADRSWRSCGDFRCLNLVTEPACIRCPTCWIPHPRWPGPECSPRLTSGRDTIRSLSTPPKFPRWP